MELRICHLYPDVLNLYGDRGNIACFRRRLEWRGIECSVTELPLGVQDSLAGYDLFFIGGGQDFEQTVLLSDINAGRGESIRSAARDGMPFLCICGGYQLLGTGYRTADGQMCEYTGIIDLYTEGSPDRMIGNFAYRLGPESGGSVVVGFENHGGRTHLGPGVRPLGTVLRGSGNNGTDGTEGVRWENIFGTYSHGPVLPKNPGFCDFILRTALERKYGAAELAPLDDSAENAARDYMLRRLHVN